MPENRPGKMDCCVYCQRYDFQYRCSVTDLPKATTLLADCNIMLAKANGKLHLSKPRLCRLEFAMLGRIANATSLLKATFQPRGCRYKVKQYKTHA